MVLITLQWSTQELRARRRESTNGTTLIHNLKKKKRTGGPQVVTGAHHLYTYCVTLIRSPKFNDLYSWYTCTYGKYYTLHLFSIQHMIRFWGYVFVISNEAQKQNKFIV